MNPVKAESFKCCEHFFNQHWDEAGNQTGPEYDPVVRSLSDASAGGADPIVT